MNQKVALVIGGNGGIGLEVVNSMVTEGIDVCCTYNKNKEELEKLIQERESDNILLCQTDICSSSSVVSALQKIYENHNKIDIVVFSVSLPIRNRQVFKMAWSDFEGHIKLQIKGLFNVIQSMKEQIYAKHKIKFIVILTEYCIGKPPSGLADYGAAKYGLMGFAKAMAIELSRFNCTVNMVSPGIVKTDLISYLPHKLIEITIENNPLKRIASPKDVADTVMFLASDKSDYLNGANIAVNGGSAIL